MDSDTLQAISALASAGGLGAMAWFFVWKLHPELVRIREVMAAVLEHLRTKNEEARLGDSSGAPTAIRDTETARIRKLRRD
jgi:hypothetical protein